MSDIATYAMLFAVAFGAATILPLQSEAMLIGLLLVDYSPVWLIAIASVGNVLGSVVNWMMGRQVEKFRNRRWFPVNCLVVVLLLDNYPNGRRYLPRNFCMVGFCTSRVICCFCGFLVTILKIG